MNCAIVNSVASMGMKIAQLVQTKTATIIAHSTSVLFEYPKIQNTDKVETIKCPLYS